MSSLGKAKCLDVQVPEGVVAQCVLNLLRSLFLSTSLHSSTLPMDTVSSVADFLKECLLCGMDETRAARTNRGRVSQMTNTLLSSLVFTRGVASLPTCGQAFCTWEWLSILLEIVERHLVLRGDQIATFITSKKKEPTRFLLDAVSGGGVLHCWSVCVLSCASCCRFMPCVCCGLFSPPGRKGSKWQTSRGWWSSSCTCLAKLFSCVTHQQ